MCQLEFQTLIQDYCQIVFVSGYPQRGQANVNSLSVYADRTGPKGQIQLKKKKKKKTYSTEGKN